MINVEQEREQARMKEINNCSDAIERQEIEARFAVERTRAQKKIENLMRSHQEELKQVEKDYSQ